MATYNVSQQLASVAFPDGRSETFTYDTGGKLETITEVGTDGTTTRTWTYTWTGDDLTRVDRPDGTAWRYEYDDPLFPGYMTRVVLVGTDGTSERVERGFLYDAAGNVEAMWQGRRRCSRRRGRRRRGTPNRSCRRCRSSASASVVAAGRDRRQGPPA